jgi:3'-phosphoadenosine 5'-phosphosulfate sulfotransferase (PAPS reductase)/FAD synthetase
MTAATRTLFDHLDDHELPDWLRKPGVPDLRSYRWIIINSSGGKDSQAMLSYLVGLCDAQGVSRDRIVVVHCDLGMAEHPGTAELAQAQAAVYGLRFELVHHDETLIEHVIAHWRRKIARGDLSSPWPDNAARFCTSDLKTTQVVKLIGRLVAEARAAGEPGRIRVLNCLGLRAQESDARLHKRPFGADPANWTTTPKAAKAPVPARPANSSAVTTGPSSRTSDRLTIRPSDSVAP